ncbi:MAG: DUF1932 domain-containing protein [Actinomycetota bacterium]|nr:DUF1932 domain-containing protein [Actinomycetota bacterium]
MRPLWTPPLDAARQAATKGWRWLAEMEQLAATFTASGLPDGFAVAAAELYARPIEWRTPLPAGPRWRRSSLLWSPEAAADRRALSLTEGALEA